VIDTLVGAGFRVKKCCEVLGISSAGYYLAKTRPISPTMIRREWLTGLIREVHADSRGTYGSRRVHAELTKGRGVHVSLALVRILMHNAEIVGIPGPRKVKRIKGTPTSDDLVQRKFERSFLDELWVTDITEHPTREGKVYCCCVLDTCSRRIVGWSIDSAQDTTLVVNALDMAIKQRRVKKGSIVHADHGTQFTSWSFTERIRDAGLMPSFGSVGDAFDNAMMESFWSSMQNELLDRKKWKTRLELSNAIFDYVEIFYNRQRRHSSIDYVSPVEFELSFKEEKTA
jgi:transposase InsO family protein